MKILFLVPYPLDKSPSQRFRFEQYFRLLDKNKIQWQTQSFWDLTTWNKLYSHGYFLTKIVGMLKGFTRRFLVLFRLSAFDIIFIHRECAPIGPPIIEWVIAKILGKKIIYDFDDAIWLTDRAAEPSWLSFIKWRSKVKTICRWSYRVSCGNGYLCDYARQFNEEVILNPTTIDTNTVQYSPKATKSNSENVIIGWTGSHSTLKYLEQMAYSLRNIEQHFTNISIMVIADRPPQLALKSIIFRPWNPKTEIEDLHQIDIGIMPLPDDEWSKGKCGFKALQFMALEIPTVASPVGVNPSIIEQGRNGFLAATDAEWEEYLGRLIMDRELRTRLGKKAREKIVSQYSAASNVKVFLSLFE